MITWQTFHTCSCSSSPANDSTSFTRFEVDRLIWKAYRVGILGETDIVGQLNKSQVILLGPLYNSVQVVYPQIVYPGCQINVDNQHFILKKKIKK